MFPLLCCCGAVVLLAILIDAVLFAATGPSSVLFPTSNVHRPRRSNLAVGRFTSGFL